MRDASTLAVAFPSYRRKPLTGWVELDLGHALDNSQITRPARVTAVLLALFARIGDLVPDAAMIDRLTTGARAWLLTRAGLGFVTNTQWYQASCESCAEVYDLALSLADTPRAETDRLETPVIEITTSQGLLPFEIPNGLTERALATSPPEHALETLARACCLSDSLTFSPDDLTLIHDQLDAATPDISDEISTKCPACGTLTRARIDPLGFAFPKSRALDREIHLIAQGYGWREGEILDLPTARRKRYAAILAAEKRPNR